MKFIFSCQTGGEVISIQMKPLYKVDNSDITIRRGPADILWFCVFVFIIAVMMETILLISMISSGNVSLLQLSLVLLLPVLSIFWCRFTAKRYDNTYVKITEEKVVFHTAGRINEIELPNLEKVILDGKTKGITALDLIMRFIMKDGSTFSYSYLGMNTYLFLNKLSMMNISIYEKKCSV